MPFAGWGEHRPRQSPTRYPSCSMRRGIAPCCARAGRRRSRTSSRTSRN
jgi:hypothetical protein